MGTKNNPGRYDCYAKLEPDEPYFLLRGKDPIGWWLVKLWVFLRRINAVKVESPEYEAKLSEAESCCKEMKQWAEKKHGSTQADETFIRRVMSLTFGGMFFKE